MFTSVDREHCKQTVVMSDHETIEELDQRLRVLEEANERLEMTKLHLLKQIMSLKRQRALDVIIQREMVRREQEEIARGRKLKKEYNRRLNKIKQIEREIDRRRGIKQSGTQKLKASKKAKKLVHPSCFSII